MAPLNSSSALSGTWVQFVEECKAAFPQTELTKTTNEEATKVKLEKLMPQDTAGSLKSFLIFGPAETCGNTITLVVDAVKKGSAAFESVAALMERMAAFLDTLSIHIREEHSTDAPQPLASARELVLKHFLNVLRQIYKLTQSKRERIKTALKALFDDDEIKISLKQMETLAMAR